MRIPVYQPDLAGNERKYLLDAFDSSWISSQGTYISKFEESFRNYVGSQHATTVSNGTVALHLALHALGIGPGDEVIVPSFTYIASVNTITQTGATPVFAESKADDWLVDPQSISDLITPKTRAVMPVHLYGAACDMDAICEIATSHGLFVVEDCAEALGTLYKGQHVGSFGDVGTFSFFGNKSITTGEGGMVVVNDPEIDRKLRTVKGQGQDPSRRYWHSELGFNYRMTNLAAAIGLAQMERVDAFLTRKREIAALYRASLNGNHGLTFQVISPHISSSNWLVSLLLPKGTDRDLIMNKLASSGVESRPVFYCAHQMPHHMRSNLSLPVAEDIAERGLSLPSYPGLSNEQVEFIADQLVSALGDGARSVSFNQ